MAWDSTGQEGVFGWATYVNDTVTATNAKGAAPKKAAGKGAKGKGKGKGKGDAEDEENADRSGVEEADDDEEGGKVSALRG